MLPPNSTVEPCLALFSLRIAGAVSFGGSPLSSYTVFLEKSIAIHVHKQEISHKYPNPPGKVFEVNRHQ
jgi:hypothetical protein